MRLIIGNKNYSSWSLRPWLLLRAFSIPFEEIRIPLYNSDSKALIRDYNEAGTVPVLLDGGLRVWDSLAICEYISEQYLDGKGWPKASNSRALARACSAEMHSGFFEIRQHLPLNCRARDRIVTHTPTLLADIARVDQLWVQCTAPANNQGPWLFGEFSIADCMFAPVALRFRTYNIQLSEQAEIYAKQILSHPAIQQWCEEAGEEPQIIDEAEVG